MFYLDTFPIHYPFSLSAIASIYKEPNPKFTPNKHIKSNYASHKRNKRKKR